MKTEIVSQLAHILRQELNPKDPKDLKVRKPVDFPKDAVEISKSTEALLVATQNDLEKEQQFKVERLKSLVQSNGYHLDDSTIENIAGRIAKSLLM